MQAASVIRIEKYVDRTASTLFALACGFAFNLWLRGDLLRPLLGAASVAAAAFAYFISVRALTALKPQLPRLPVPIFDVREVEPMDRAELLLPDGAARGLEELLLNDRLELAPASEPLLLDDILAELGSNSRVVRLFDRAAMPTAGELKSRIDQHLESEVSEARTDDAAQALHDALAELRRSLR